jgi:hypothetical protein
MKTLWKEQKFVFFFCNNLHFILITIEQRTENYQFAITIANYNYIIVIYNLYFVLLSITFFSPHVCTSLSLAIWLTNENSKISPSIFSLFRWENRKNKEIFASLSNITNYCPRSHWTRSDPPAPQDSLPAYYNYLTLCWIIGLLDLNEELHFIFRRYKKGHFMLHVFHIQPNLYARVRWHEAEWGI